MKICLQAGHKNRTSGATGAPREQEFNIDITNKLERELKKLGQEIYVCDSFANNDKKVTGNDWDLFLSIHYDADIYNSGGGFCDRPAIDYAAAESKRIMEIIEANYFQITGIKNVPQRRNANTSKYYMWNSLSKKTPCVIIECGVGMHKPDDFNVLHNNRALVVKALLSSICKALNIKLADVPESNSMIEDLLKKYNVKTLEEFGAIVEKHCGTDFNGGFLGSEREKNKRLEKENDDLLKKNNDLTNRNSLLEEKNTELEKSITSFQDAIVGQKHHILRLESELSDCRNSSGDSEWELNGKEVTTIEGNTTTKLNYRKK
jgi:hypothetical protein